jgi:hypothetical protein
MHRLAASEGSSLRSRTARLVVAALVLGACTRVDAQDLVFKGLDFESWNHPRGLVKVLPGGVEVKRFGKGFNAVANAGEFSSSVIGISGLRPEHAASNQSQAHRVTDQDPATWWQPDPADPLQTWWVEIDLGRAVVATAGHYGRQALHVLFRLHQPGHSRLRWQGQTRRLQPRRSARQQQHQPRRRVRSRDERSESRRW